MNLSQITSADLQRIGTLLEKREALQSQLNQINSQLAAYDSGAPAPRAKGKPGRKPAASAPSAAPRAKRSQRGALKAAVMKAVAAAGKGGISVKALAGKLGLESNRIYTWFYTTGKGIKEIKKVGEAQYAWAPAVAAAPSAPAAKPVAPAKPGAPAKSAAPAKPAALAKPAAKSPRAGRTQPGHFTESILTLIKGAGKPGVTVKAIATQLGVDPQRIYAWFNATGKRRKDIKKVAPATYSWAG